MSWNGDNNNYKTKSLAKLIGKALFYASIQSAIGSVEMSSKFSVMNFSKDQETLQNAADALKGYMIIASIWTLGTVLVMWSEYGLKGGIVGFIANGLMMTWIYFSYIYAFKQAAKKYNLQEPSVW